MNNWTCPECGHPWSRNYLFDHDRGTCTIGKAEDATHHADYERLGTRSRFVREITAAETMLFEYITGHGIPPEATFRHPHDPIPRTEAPKTEVIGITAGIRRRVIAGIDPDTLDQEEKDK